MGHDWERLAEKKCNKSHRGIHQSSEFTASHRTEDFLAQLDVDGDVMRAGRMWRCQIVYKDRANQWPQLRNNSWVSCMFLWCVYLPINKLKTTPASRLTRENDISPHSFHANQSWSCGLRPGGVDFVNESIEGCGALVCSTCSSWPELHLNKASFLPLSLTCCFIKNHDDEL